MDTTTKFSAGYPQATLDDEQKSHFMSDKATGHLRHSLLPSTLEPDLSCGSPAACQGAHSSTVSPTTRRDPSSQAKETTQLFQSNPS